VDTYNSLKNEVLHISERLSAFFSDAKQFPGIYDPCFESWEKTCRDIQKALSEDVIRAAVAGSIKSGKSTFVNALFKGDYVKRGAGVVTSIVTRIRSGETLRAKLCFKSFDEVNADMSEALVLFPMLKRKSAAFDIRHDEDRAELQQALADADRDLLITNDSRSMNSVLLESYLSGYEKVKETVAVSENRQLQYEGKDFQRHQEFSGNDALAVWLKDMQLEIVSHDIDGNIEIADCQGSDSPNPLHLAMIQDYLIRTDMIVYVISSRMGMRQADIRFLSVIRKMGIMDNIVFVLNADFNEHESLGDLKAVIEKVKAELSLIKAEPEIYTFSALLNLFRSRKEHLSAKDRHRLSQWEQDTEFPAFSDRESARFESYFKDKITKERYALVFKNHIGRLLAVSSGMNHRIGVNTDMLCRDADSADEIVRKIKLHQQNMSRIKAMMQSTLEGAVKKIRQELRTDIDRFFDMQRGNIQANTLAFIRNYNVSCSGYENSLSAGNFTNVLYSVFQEFRQAVDSFIAENINPEIIRFVREEEKKIVAALQSVIAPYEMTAQAALGEYNKAMESFGIPPMPENRGSIELPDTEVIKRSKDLSFPAMTSSMRYSAKIKTEAVMRFGLYSFMRFFKKMLKASSRNGNDGEVSALKKGLSRIKSETESALVFHFKDYRENIKFQYLFRVTDALSEVLYDILTDRFQLYAADLSDAASRLGENQGDKAEIARVLKKMESAFGEIIGSINILKHKIEPDTDSLSIFADPDGFKNP